MDNCKYQNFDIGQELTLSFVNNQYVICEKCNYTLTRQSDLEALYYGHCEKFDSLLGKDIRMDTLRLKTHQTCPECHDRIGFLFVKCGDDYSIELDTVAVERMRNG